jgi:aconitate hydratase
MVFAYALAGRSDIDFDKEPICKGSNVNDAFLTEILPDREEIHSLKNSIIEPKMLKKNYDTNFNGSKTW